MQDLADGDRNNYAAARLQGLEKDLNLHGNEYQVGVSILFVAYVSVLPLIFPALTV
jgi:hypothetical protein